MDFDSRELQLKKKVLVSALLLTCFSQGLYAAKGSEKIRMYKYKDKDGVTVIKDYLPAEIVPKGYSVVDKYGNVIEVVARVKTKEEKAAEKLRQKKAAEEEAKIKKQLKRDNELLRQFTTTEDIIRARENQLDSIRVEIGIRASNTNRIKRQLKKYQAKAADFERRGQPVPKALQDNIEISLKQIEDSGDFITAKNDEQDKVVAAYAIDIKRFDELNAQRKRRLAANAAQRALLSKNSYHCDDLSLCAKAWQLAQLYAKEYASGRIELITDTLIITEKPHKDTDISLAFSRIPDRENKVEIRLDLYCADSAAGKSLCASGKATAIKKGMPEYIKSHL